MSNKINPTALFNIGYGLYVVTAKDGDKDNVFVGIKCRWFDNNTVLREAIFSTKDLTHYNG